MGIKGMDCGEFPTVVNAVSPGQAKMEYLRILDGCLVVKFTDITCRVVGGPQSSKDFVRCAEYRGLPRLRCGDRVAVGAARGVVVGHNASANFEVLFDLDSPKYAGLRVPVHPSELSVL